MRVIDFRLGRQAPRPLPLKLRIPSESSRIPKNSGGCGQDANSARAPNSWEFGYAQLQRPLRESRRVGLTVLELVVVCAIMALLAALLLPAIASTREAARRAQCSSNLRQIGIALSSYHDVYRALPPGWRLDSSGHSAFGWAAAILPNIEHGGLGERIDFLASVDSPSNAFIRHQPVSLFLCPSDIAPRSFALYHENGGHDAKWVSSSTVLFHLPNANYVGVFGISDPDAVDGTVGEGAFRNGAEIKPAFTVYRLTATPRGARRS